MPDRDELVDRLLRRVMPDDLRPLQQACVDGETLAAWSEGALRGAEAAAVEAHVSDCARCRALMAAFVRTASAEPVPQPLWRRWHLGWVVPLATAATAAAIWVALPDSGAPLPSPQEINAVARSSEPAREKPKTAESTANELRQRVDERGTRELPDRQARSATDAVAPSLSAPAAGAAAAPPTIAPAAPPQAAPPQAAAVAERDEADAKKETAANAAFAPLAAQRRAFAADQIASPDGSTRWRIVDGQRLERSTDAGAYWTPVTLGSPDRLTAGAAPSAAVCWIVGARGAVYLTTDGTRFMRLPFTEITDLTSVFATDALSATVTSADGRSWRTTDQGRTWSTTR